MLRLFEHNNNAYHAAMDLMRRTGKAAVIHPTGTGKSIIAFKLVEECPKARILWLSPSTYIVETQRENVRRLDPNFWDDHVIYCTYARLMNMGAEEMTALRPAYIIFDEFHRCGASEWGKGVRALMEMYPNAYMLGLSATNIRYLDNQRDMAEELFDGHIASEMSLAEAIATGILPAPKYILAMYSYQKELEKYQRRVNSRRHRSNFDANKRYLDALRRSLEMAIGLDEVFQKHIVDKTGKYIVFCSGKEHIDLVRSLIPEWFSAIDREPRIYTVYSEELGSESAFAEFKSDSSPHLKLLLCIDMLSEGIHVDDISGVILLRPTVSPIVYKQQIGRALAAGKGGNPLIFDIVNNFEGLCSVSYLQEEMQSIAAAYWECGTGEKIVEETFQVVDEVRDCRKLLNQLEESLTATWDVNYQHAKAYYLEHGDLNIPAAYRTADDIHLGVWISYQRHLYNSKYRGTLTSERIEKLNSIGMVWSNRYETSWENMFRIAEDYYLECGDLKVPSGYVTSDGVQLGRWLRRQADSYERLSEDKIARLNEIGLEWNNQWENRYERALGFLRENPQYELSQTTTIGDFWVGKWIVQQLRAYEKGTLSEAQAKLISQMIQETGVSGKTKAQKQWEMQFLKAKSLVDEYGTWNRDVKSEEDKKTVRWIKRQLQKLEMGALPEDQTAKLRDIGIRSNGAETPWMKYYHFAEQYRQEYGNLNIPAAYVTPEGVRLGAWLSRQRSLYDADANISKLTGEQKALLEKLGIQWDPRRTLFEQGMNAAGTYYSHHHDLHVPTNYVDDKGFPLYRWIVDIRKRKTSLSGEDVARLDAMGFEWRKSSDVKKAKIYSEVKSHVEAGGELNVSYRFKTASGFNLGRYLSAFRKEYKTGQYQVLSLELVNLLNVHGMHWE